MIHPIHNHDVQWTSILLQELMISISILPGFWSWFLVIFTRHLYMQEVGYIILSSTINYCKECYICDGFTINWERIWYLIRKIANVPEIISVHGRLRGITYMKWNIYCITYECQYFTLMSWWCRYKNSDNDGWVLCSHSREREATLDWYWEEKIVFFGFICF